MRGSYDTDYHDCHLAYYDSKSKSTLDSDRSCGSNNEGKEFCSDDKQDEFEIEYFYFFIYYFNLPNFNMITNIIFL